MRAHALVPMAIAAAYLAALPAGIATADAIDATVVRVEDGDSLIVRDARGRELEVRIVGIDAPELGQAGGDESREHLEGLVGGKQVEVRYDVIDSFGRLIGKVMLNGRDVGFEQLTSGMAWAYAFLPGGQSDEEKRLYREAQDVARRERTGIWADVSPPSPWEYRGTMRERVTVPPD